MTVSAHDAAGPAPQPAYWTGDVWRLQIVHRTALTYPDTVTTSYNEVRMQPAEEAGQSVLSSRLEIDPFEGVLPYVDHWGTRVAAFDVHRPHRHLTVTATSTVETFDIPSRDPVPHLDWDALAGADVSDTQEEFLSPTPLTELDDELLGVAQQLRESSATPAAAGRAVCDLIRRRLTYEQGATGVHTSAVEAWHERRGVCQDFSHLAVALLRAVRIPARYVSGYLHPQPDAEIGRTVVGESHSWVEWWDGAWTAFDPTNGAPPGHAHVVVGRGRDYRDVPPVKGVYAGPAATGNEVTVRVTRVR
ncbi:transglutaminase family protein [Nakamurella endophytica]|uniref:Transglutaminase-like domain-containing protein n=1 Tax=Nakamurella endophytica TaxID=1748367 RepID=A0A917WA84_9ACTN|nr:transglutaminase family protein [Nakamurella endophytica]GGL87929.1 hypothetical protein GCM10011594_04440 [Nakamurella endophytica]